MSILLFFYLFISPSLSFWFVSSLELPPKNFTYSTPNTKRNTQVYEHKFITSATLKPKHKNFKFQPHYYSNLPSLTHSFKNITSEFQIQLN